MSEKQFVDQDTFLDFDRLLAARETEASVPGVATNEVISKEDILRRIEEDRERHKRLRESLWVVPSGDPDYEFTRAWEETSDLCEDDFEVMREELALCRQSHMLQS